MGVALTRLTQQGREAGFHRVACAQEPTATVMGSLVESSFPLRIVGSVASPEDAKVATGNASTGAERLLRQVDFLVAAKGQVTRMRAAHAISSVVRDQLGSSSAAANRVLLDATETEGVGRFANLAVQVRTRVHRIRQRGRNMSRRLLARTNSQAFAWVHSCTFDFVEEAQ